MNSSPVARSTSALLSNSPQSLSAQTASRLLAELREGGARKGDRLPSERLLAERCGVSRVTLRSALGELRRQGVISTSSTRGWFVGNVDAGPGQAQAPGHTVQGFADFAAATGLEVRAQVRSASTRPSTVEEARALRIAPGAALFELHRLRYLNDLVVVEEYNRIPLNLCPSLPDVDFTTASLYATLRQADPPQIPRVAEYTVEARRPSPTEAALLEIDDSAPVLVATQLSYNQHDNPMELTVQVYRGDRYRFTASITN
ncbi:GntR family transcriptional regulator [Glaciibacter superstes]|uniref:GntR family transcriptional regulator n=1 Tax=Glaciibacter superstes TaxID=501023 RepID=UPI0003B3A2F6|nr:GntR family transcriptional regulator [Glaciibacter superstes]